MAISVALAVITLGRASLASGAAPGPDLASEAPIARAGSSLASERPIGARGLRRRLGALMEEASSSSGAWVFATERDKDSDGGRTLFREDGGDRRAPASNMKLFTTATALDVFGPSKRLRTRIYGQGRITRGVLRGDLYFVGGGDPALSSRTFARGNDLPQTRMSILASRLERLGLERVRGSIIVDDTIFDRVRGVPDSNWATSEWIGPLGGLTYNSGTAEGGGFVSDPAIAAGEELEEGLRKRGIRVGGRVKLGKLPAKIREKSPLAFVRSPEIGAMIDPLNNFSLNFFAEMLLKRIASERREPGTTKRGTRIVERYANSIGSGIRAVDGSGLTATSKVSPHEVGDLLLAMLDERGAGAFYESLPIAGREGTLAYRMRGTAAEGACRGKTGTLTGVSALSGYCKTGGRLVIFSILMNGVSSDSYAHQLQDEMVALIARYEP